MKTHTKKARLALVFVATASLIGLGAWRHLNSAYAAGGDPELTGGAAVVGLKNQQIPISDIQITGDGNPTVPVRMFVSNGSLSFGSTTGLTFTGSSSGSTLTFSGTLSNVNAALATLRYTRTTVGSDTLEISLVASGEIFFTGNGNLYEFVTSTTTWQQAKSAAEGRSKYGASGYLATITSSEENDFVADRLLGAGWMGASDAASEGDWKWVTGPETGTSFWSGSFNGSAVGGAYENWNNGEPNNAGSGEDCGQFLAGSTGLWNDLPCSGSTLGGYVVEYGAPGARPEVSSLNVSVTTTATPSNPASLGPTAVVNGAWASDTTPTFTFSLLDEEVEDELKYRIQVDDNSDFSSPVVSYESGFKSQGSFNFYVGQAAGEGTSGVGSYSVGEEGQTLGDSQYYWRVQSEDEHGNTSNYVTANGGSVAFGVDVTAPSVPGTPSTTTPSNDSTPTWAWEASSDGESGLLASSYVMQWSQDPDFGGFITASTTTNSYTIPSALAEGTWYFRVRARDNVLNYSAYSANDSVVIDETEPSIVSLVPADDSTQVARGTSLVIQFDEIVNRGSGAVTIYAASDDSVVETIDITSDKVLGIGTDTLTIAPSSPLEFGQAYYVHIDATALDDPAGNSFAGIQTSVTWNFTVIASDVDQDGILNSVEDAAPNGGDANDDGVLDSTQDNVASFENPVTNTYVALAVSGDCVITSVGIDTEEATVNSQDVGFDYPAGIMDFSLECDEVGATVTATHYYYGVQTKSLVVRKYNPLQDSYLAIIDASITQRTIDDTSVAAVAYAITDGAERDVDGVRDGSIRDPAGLARNIIGAPNTGLGGREQSGQSAASLSLLLLSTYSTRSALTITR